MLGWSEYNCIKQITLLSYALVLLCKCAICLDLRFLSL
jgi:hypothetical protein